MSDILKELDVKDCAEDNEELVRRYKVETTFDAEIEDWQSGDPVVARGPYEHTTAVVIKMRSGDGTVKVFNGNQNVRTHHTSARAKEEVIMVFLNPGYSCWWMLEAKVKFIKGIGKA